VTPGKSGGKRNTGWPKAAPKEICRKIDRSRRDQSVSRGSLKSHAFISSPAACFSSHRRRRWCATKGKRNPIPALPVAWRFRYRHLAGV